MTLYTQAEKNVRRTWILMTCFLVFIIFLGWLFTEIFDSPIFLIIAVFLSVFQSITSYLLSDKIILSMARAKPIEKKDNPNLYLIVENLCITAGLPLPKIYILNESQPNAFATGRDKNHAAIAVTRGLLEKLDKTELEGVIAHELSHIGNKDMLLQTIIVTLTGIISLISEFFLRISFLDGTRGRDSDNNASLIIFGIIASILAPFVAALIQLAISRKREFLADASGALLTRYPEGLARALEKISQDPHPLRTANNSTAHLYFANPFRGKESTSWFRKLFMTHPPVEERIKALREMSV